jgi:hypothetical protein
MILALLLGGCTSRASAPSSTADTQTHFATPRALVEALVTACRNGDNAALVAAVGEANKTLVVSSNAADDQARCKRFVTAADAMTRLDPAGPNTLVLVVGSDDYPLPVPLVKDAQGWRLDTDAGADEIIRRTVGGNELRAISTCRAAATGTPPPFTANGYGYRALGGPDVMAVAVPLVYRRTGVMTFVATKNGTIYENDLGSDTSTLAGAITGAAPDASWTVVSD